MSKNINDMTEEYVARKARISELNAELNREKEANKNLEQDMIEAMSVIGVPRLGTGSANLSVSTKTLPNVEDWDAFYNYIKQNDAFYLLQRRIATTAANEILALGDDIPGVNTFETEVLSVRRIAPSN